MAQLPASVCIRPFRETDRSFLATTFAHTAHDIALFQGTPDRLFRPPMQRLFDRMVTHPKAAVAVVCDNEDTDFIVGWLCAWILDDVSVVWYAYVRNKFRRKGICSHLIETLPGRSKASVFTSKVGHRISEKFSLVRYPTLMLEVFR